MGRDLFLAWVAPVTLWQAQLPLLTTLHRRVQKMLSRETFHDDDILIMNNCLHE